MKTVARIVCTFRGHDWSPMADMCARCRCTGLEECSARDLRRRSWERFRAGVRLMRRIR